MSMFPRSRAATSPYRLLLLATLAAVVLVQLVAMAVVTRSQVRKAEAHYAARAVEGAADRAGGRSTAPASDARPAATTPARGVVNVGYVAAR